MSGLWEINFVFRSPFCWGKRRSRKFRTERCGIGKKDAEDGRGDLIFGKKFSGGSELLMI